MRVLLRVEHLTRRFRGLTATDDVSMDVIEGELHALIGPNGAGKTTLINLLSGELRPDAGTIVFDGCDVTRTSIQERALKGLVRSFQITSVFPELTVRQNVMLAVQAVSGHTFRFIRDVRTDSRLIAPAREALRVVGLEESADRPVADLAHGARRQLDMAMVLALTPRLMLLDEPLAGMSGADAESMVDLLGRLKSSCTVVLVEHDMDAVFSLADRLTVLAAGRPVATGTPEQIRNDPMVRDAYLGEEDMYA
ncbi:MAG: ABC transporter ATP-binding protein [Burkholderiales bacterium]|nr:ABC transporter ATP-binding protein [Burkholderiaceae bacterium]